MPDTVARRTLVALVEDNPGVLTRIAGLFFRRGMNIASLAVGHGEEQGLSRMTFVVEGDPGTVGHIARQLDKLVEVIEVEDISEKNIVWREMALVRIRATSETRPRVLQLAEVFRVSVVDIGGEAVTVEVTGDTDKINSLIKLMDREFAEEPGSTGGVVQVMRTGRVAMLRSALRPGDPDGEPWTT